MAYTVRQGSSSTVRNSRATGRRSQISRRMDLTFNLGLDYYFSSTLKGHDTAYSPDGSSVNPREDYEYGDADAAVGQPKFRPRLATGLQYHF